jgi:hypothetical protein
LEKRRDKDIRALKPDVLSILFDGTASSIWRCIGDTPYALLSGTERLCWNADFQFPDFDNSSLLIT